MTTVITMGTAEGRGPYPIPFHEMSSLPTVTLYCRGKNKGWNKKSSVGNAGCKWLTKGSISFVSGFKGSRKGCFTVWWVSDGKNPAHPSYILIGFRQVIKNVNTAKAVLKLPQHKEEGKQTELYWFPLGPEQGGSHGYSRNNSLNHFLIHEWLKNLDLYPPTIAVKWSSRLKPKIHSYHNNTVSFLTLQDSRNSSLLKTISDKHIY